MKWEGLMWETRGFLGLEEGEPVPVDELRETAIANGWEHREVDDALRSTTALETVNDDPDNPRVVLSDALDETPERAGENLTNADSCKTNTPAGADPPDPADAPERDTCTDKPTYPDEEGRSRTWEDVDFSTPEPDTYPPELLEQERWMLRLKGEKSPYAPWTDPDAPAPCDRREHDEPTTCDKCDHSARFKWGWTGNYRDGETARMAEVDPAIGGRVFLQTDEGPYAFVDGDDVRDPDTGEVHPEFIALLEELGVSYADISTSGTGVHVYYRGELPDRAGPQATFGLDTEPWGANDSIPEVEIYANKHVNVTTGDHVPGSGLEVRAWDTDALEAILDERDLLEDPEPQVSHDTDRERDELEEHDPTATGRDETTDDLRDILHAVDRLRPGDLPLDTRPVGEDATGWELWDPSSYRSSESGESLHKPPDEPVFYDHKHGEGFGLLSLFAAERGILSEPWEPLDGAEWWEAVDEAREAGAPIPAFEGARSPTGEPYAVLPDSPKGRALASGWDWTADRRGEATLSIDEARERTQDAIADALEYADTVLVDALPTTGKSRGSIEAAADTGEPVTILTGRGRKEQYDQYREWARDLGLAVYTLPSFPRDCPTAAGEHGDELKATVRDWYRRGATPKEIHKNAEYELGEPLGCQKEGKCPYASLWNFDPEDYDVILGHYSHGHKPKVTAGRAVIFDEFPGGAYETTLGGYLEDAVTHYLETTDALPFDSWTDLVENRSDEARRADALLWFEDRDLEPDAFQVFDGDRTHAFAPLAVFTLLASEDLGNGWERADLGDGRIGLYDRGKGDVYLLNPPPLDPVRNAVALDGTPTREMWERALGLRRLNHRQVLTDDERREYLRDVLGHRYIRTTEWVKPYNNADHVNLEDDAALLEAIADEHGERPAIITSRTAEAEYIKAGILEPQDDVDEALERASDADERAVLASASKHYGDVLGSNQFKTERLGAVLGSNHYGDGFIKKWGALADEAVERVDGARGRELAYTGIGDRILEHMREHDTLQAAMRFGRDGNGAVVYVHTDTLPEWVPVAGEGRVVHTWSEGMRDVLTALEDLDAPTTADVVAHPAVSLSERCVFNHLETLRDRGVLTREHDPADGRRFVWRDDGLHRVGEHGAVELEPVAIDEVDDEAIEELARISVYTWGFRKTGGEPAREGDPPPAREDPPSSTGPNLGDRASHDTG